MTDIATVARAQSLLDELAAARVDAVRWDFDLPSDLAYQRAVAAADAAPFVGFDRDP